MAEFLSWAEVVQLSGMLVPATTYDRFPDLLTVCQRSPLLYPALGLHPIYLPQHTDAVLNDCAAFIRNNKPIAIGEIGLDYFVTELDKTRQQQIFEFMIDCASELALPLILHVRRSHDAVIATLKRKQFKFGGIVHAFSGSTEQANEFIKRGFVLGFGGVLTYQSAHRVRRVAQTVSLEHIVLETDAPDMPPSDWPLPHNSPQAIERNFAALCALRSEEPAELARVTTANARRVLHLS